MKICFYPFGILLLLVNFHTKADSLNNPYLNECSSVVSLDECKRYANCRLRGGTKTDCLDKDLKGKSDGFHLITPDAEERAHRNALNDARKKLQEFERDNAGRLCSQPVIVNGKVINYVQAPCR